MQGMTGGTSATRTRRGPTARQQAREEQAANGAVLLTSILSTSFISRSTVNASFHLTSAPRRKKKKRPGRTEPTETTTSIPHGQARPRDWFFARYAAPEGRNRHTGSQQRGLRRSYSSCRSETTASKRRNDPHGKERLSEMVRSSTALLVQAATRRESTGTTVCPG